MQKKILQTMLIVLLLVSGPVYVKARSNNTGVAAEKVVLFADRSIYIAGEQVQFYAKLVRTDPNGHQQLSQVLYCELISPDGNKMAWGKFLILESSVTGCIPIPADLLTGTYYLRAYTRQMRNYGPEWYGYLQMRVVNPGKPEVAQTGNSKDKPTEANVQIEAPGQGERISVSAEKQVYSPRDTVRLQFQAAKLASGSINSMCLSVVPEAVAATATYTPHSAQPARVGGDSYTETRGLSLVGKLTEAKSTVPLKGKKVNLSIIGPGRDFMAVRTDSSGRFFFALPDYYGSRDLYLCAERSVSKDVKIWVDNDFCTTPFHLSTSPFSLSAAERLAVYDMALNVQIQKHFNKVMPVEPRNTDQAGKAFYGKPTTTIYLDEYVQLPTLEEYFNELSSLVKVRKHKGEQDFYVMGSRDLSFYDPLVLIDWVAVDEPAKILSVSPLNISRIEIVNEPYVKGGQTYGGIISIVSKKGDFAGIDLPSSGIFLNYSFLSETQCGLKANSLLPEQPDARNTLLWVPGLTVRENEAQNCAFTAPDSPGKYRAVLEGLTTTGERFRQSCVFEVVK
jgi:hypothetical protein